VIGKVADVQHVPPPLRGSLAQQGSYEKATLCCLSWSTFELRHCRMGNAITLFRNYFSYSHPFNTVSIRYALVDVARVHYGYILRETVHSRAHGVLDCDSDLSHDVVLHTSVVIRRP